MLDSFTDLLSLLTFILYVASTYFSWKIWKLVRNFSSVVLMVCFLVALTIRGITIIFPSIPYEVYQTVLLFCIILLDVALYKIYKDSDNILH